MIDERVMRVLYISGSIGLGHVSKDLAIAGEYGRTVNHAPMPVDGAAKAAAHIHIKAS
jgi:hypothetical protein